MTRSTEVIVTCAVTGSGDTVRKNPAVPVTPREIADSALEAAKAGAAIVHIHVRNPETSKPSMDLALYREVYDRIRSANPDVIVNLTTGPGQRFMPSLEDPRIPGPGTTLTTPEVRVRHVVELCPEICSLDVATMVTGAAYGGTVMVNTLGSLQTMASAIRAAGTKPELEVFDSGHLRLANHLIDTGYVDRPPFFQLCLGIEWGAPATAAAVQYLSSLLPPDAVWAAFGVGPEQFPMVACVVAAGGHVRVGFEDNLYIARGRLAPSNAALVERAVKLIELQGASVASPRLARTLLGLTPRVAASHPDTDATG